MKNKDDAYAFLITCMFMGLFFIMAVDHYHLKHKYPLAIACKYDDANVKAWILEKHYDPNFNKTDPNNTIRVENGPIFEITPEHVREIRFELTKEMDIISEYIEGCNYNLSKIVADKIAYEVVCQCKKEKLPTPLILGIMQTESNFNPMALSKKKARGLMQVLDKACKGETIDKSRLHNIGYNIESGIKILKSKLDFSKGDLDRALFYYVGRDKKYSAKIYRNISDFMFFNSKNKEI